MRVIVAGTDMDFCMPEGEPAQIELLLKGWAKGLEAIS